MNLKALLACLQKYEAHGPLDIEIKGLSYDSKSVRKGDLFAALPGMRLHGSQFVPDAEHSGAVVILTDRPIQTNLSQILVENARWALARLSAAFYSSPSQRLKLYGVTGTNGKTTSTFLMRSILAQASMRTGLVGTIQYSGANDPMASGLTTPESLDLQRLLSSMVAEKCDACVMEVSSHSLVQYRVASCVFEAAIFTNLTQDHLDYHKTMEDYFQAKRMLFCNETCRVKKAIINIDDHYGQRILSSCSGNIDFVTFGFDEKADFCISGWTSDVSGSEIVIRHPAGTLKLQAPFIGRYNALNICGAVAATLVTGIPEHAIAAGIQKMEQVPGRLEIIDHGQPFLVVIDYAHTEDAMRQLLRTMRPYTKGRLIVLFGCGGDRDQGKRPLMGRAAGELGDVVILTSDNPRSEDPQKIIGEITKGVKESGNKNLHSIIDRKEAIAFAVRQAEPGDTLVLTGKGHENYQIIGTEKLHFDEREILSELLTQEGGPPCPPRH